MNYIAQIDFNENSSFILQESRSVGEKIRGKSGQRRGKKEEEALLMEVRLVYTLLCEKKIAALIISRLALRLERLFQQLLRKL